MTNEVNAMSHIEQFENYFALRGVPKQLQSNIPLRSVTDHTARSWISVASRDLDNYDEFRAVFMKPFRKSVTQGNIRRSNYQDK
jgi:hypothetical protein